MEDPLRGQLATVNERYTAWRRWLDVCFLVLHLWGAHFPNTIFVLRFSICFRHHCSGPLQPFAPEARTDPWLQDFPCAEPSRLACGVPWNFGNSLVSFSKMMADVEGPQVKRWLSTHWHWAVPYVNMRYTPLGTVPDYLMALAVLLLPFTARGWWLRGGRTLVMSTWRLTVSNLYTMAFLLSNRRSKVHIWDLFDSPWRLLPVIVLKRGTLGMVPWDWHWRVTLAEAACILLSWLMRHGCQPPSGQLLPMLLAAIVAVCISLALSRLEGVLMQQVPLMLQHSKLLLQDVQRQCTLLQGTMRAWVVIMALDGLLLPLSLTVACCAVYYAALKRCGLVAEWLECLLELCLHALTF